jgi:hypothetical protein
LSVLAIADVAVIETSMIVIKVFMMNSSVDCSVLEKIFIFCSPRPVGSAAPIVDMTVANSLAGATAIIRKISDYRRAWMADHDLVAHDEAIATCFLGNRRASSRRDKTNHQHCANENPHDAAPLLVRRNARGQVVKMGHRSA